MELLLNVVGSYCNSWPNLVVELNQKKIFDGPIENEQEIKIKCDDLLDKGNNLVVGMNNKSFGKNGVWDTVTKDNKIVADKKIKIKNFKLDGIDCKSLFGGRFVVKRTDRQPTYFPDKIESFDEMYYNGYFSLKFDLPLYNFIINKKYKQELSDDISYFSNYTKVFHYEEEIEIINSIKEILKEVDAKFSSKRTKIRNS